MTNIEANRYAVREAIRKAAHAAFRRKVAARGFLRSEEPIDPDDTGVRH